jgi:primary-amine oxidase
MPMEKHEMHIRPADFFNFNPALDVPGNKNLSSVQVNGEGNECCSKETHSGAVQETPTSHFQGTATIRSNGDSRL